MPGKKWTEGQDYVVEGTEYQKAEQVGRRLNRSLSAIEHRRLRLSVRGIAGPWGPKRKWDPEEDAIIRSTLHLLADQVVPLLNNRTAKAIQARRSKLDLQRKYRSETGWTPEKDDVLRSTLHMTAEQAAEVLACAVMAVESRRSVLGLGRIEHFWTPEEDAIVRSTLNLTAEQVARMLNSRTAQAVKQRRKKLFLHSVGKRVKGSKKWTGAEDTIIRTTLHLSTEQVSQQLKGRTSKAIEHRRSRLALESDARPKQWTEDEDAVIRATLRLDAEQVTRMLSGRTVQAVIRRRKTLK